MTPIKWEKVDLPSAGFRGSKIEKTIWLTGGKDKEHPNRMNISGDLCHEVGFKSGTPIWLYSYGDMFMIKSEPSDYYLKSQTGHIEPTSSGTLALTNANFVCKLLPYKNGKVFDAWVEDGTIVFKKRSSM